MFALLERTVPRANDAAITRVYDSLGAALPEGCVSREADRLERYGTDESGAGTFLPQLVALPRSTEQVVDILRTCAAQGVPVTPRGAGTGRAGGALPVEGGLVLALERMNAIQEIDPASMLAVAQAGVITGELQRQVEELGLFYPPDPNSLDSCHLGGNVATNAGGPRAVKYGVTREYVLGLEVVLMGGEVLRPGRRTLKGVAGYDLTALLVGSEGTLGVITEITVRLRPRPAKVETALLFFDSIQQASRAVLGIMQAGHAPRTLEIMDSVSIDAVRSKARFRFPPGESAALILELDGERDGPFEELTRIAEHATEKLGATDVIVAQNETQRRELWEARRIMSSALREKHGRKYSEDIAVPLGRIPECIDRIHEIAEARHVAAAIYGHAGDGNLHVNLLFEREDQWPEVMAAAEDIFRLTVELGGTITGEHGIGLLKRGFLELEQSAPLIAMQRRLKHLWDPDDLLNPGKLLPA